MDDFKMYDQVVDIAGEWEGYIDTINKQGKIRVKTLKGHEWVFPFQIKHKSKTSVVTEKKNDLRFF
jgi:hypothetical protein